MPEKPKKEILLWSISFVMLVVVFIAVKFAWQKSVPVVEAGTLRVVSCKIINESLCHYAIGLKIEDEFEERFVIVQRCGLYSSGDILVIAKSISQSGKIK